MKYLDFLTTKELTSTTKVVYLFLETYYPYEIYSFDFAKIAHLLHCSSRTIRDCIHTLIDKQLIVDLNGYYVLNNIDKFVD